MMDIIYKIEFIIELFIIEFIFTVGFKTKKLFWLPAVFGSSVCIAIMVHLNPNIYWLGSVKYLLCFLISIFMIFFIWKVNVGNACYIGISGYAIQHIGYCFEDLIRRLISQSEVIRTFLWQNDFIALAIKAVCFALVYVAMYWLVIRKFRSIRETQINNIPQIIIATAVLLTTVTLNLLVIQYGRGLHIVVRVAFRLYAIMSCLFAIIIQNNLFWNRKLERDKIILNKLLQSECKHHEMTKENIQFINVKCHDLKKQIAGLRKITDCAAKEESIKEIEDAILFLDHNTKTGNESLDILFFEKSTAFYNNGIQFSYFIDGAALRFVNPVDLYTLFGNILDNAQESVMKIADKDKRVVSLKAYGKEQIYVIEAENYFEGQLTFRKGIPLTSKSDKLSHGYGMKSIELTVEKYHGNLSINTADNLFQVHIIIPIPPPRSQPQ